MDTSNPRRLGKSELHLKPFGFGGGTIGDPRVSATQAVETVVSAWDCGVQLFDTAPWYGIGRSERRLGVALSEVIRARSIRREDFMINTKVGKAVVPEPDAIESNDTYCADGSIRTPRDPRSGFRIAFDYSYEAILSQHYDSMQRLGHARVDSLTIHDIDYGYQNETQIESCLDQLSKSSGGGATALEELRDAGVIRAIGCGCNLESRNAFSWDGSAHEDLIERIIELVDLDFLIVAGAYTLLENRALRRILPLCQERNIGAIMATPFAGGWLVNPEQALYMYGEAGEDIRDRTKRLSATCTQFDVPLAAAAIQFQLAHPVVAAVIPGAKSVSEVTENHQLVNLDIPEDLWDVLKDQDLIHPDAPVPSQKPAE